MNHERGQVLAFFAVVVPIVLLPLAAYAVNAAVVAYHAGGLQAATAQAAETAAQQLDTGAIRSGSGLALDAVAARRVATQTVEREDPSAIVDSLTIAGIEVAIQTRETFQPPFALLTGPVTLHASARALLVAGYASPRSPLPFSSSTL